MVRPQFRRHPDPELQPVLDALDDEDCRATIRALDEPKTAKELSEECDIALSTMYRKLNLLTDASLLEEVTEIRPDGHHRSRYRITFEEVDILLDSAREFDVHIVRPAAQPDQRLAELWGRVREET